MRARGATIAIFVAIVICAFGGISQLGVTRASLAHAEWWRLLTSQFVHVFIAHALLNAFAVLAIGWSLEPLIGSGRFVASYVVAGTIGQLVALVVAPRYPASGASQAALGIAAMLIVFARNDRRLLAAPVAYSVVQLALDLAFAHMVKLPHVASFAAGLFFGAAFRIGSERRTIRAADRS